ncbi:hypothetical protein BH23BAC2_BH23BAC2_17900 [soil metagenome]
MTFLNSTFLWALLGLVVPVAIHLWSKKEGRTVKVGSIRLLRESDPRKTSNIKLNELWLLLLRMLAIIILVLILAEPQMKREIQTSPLTYLIEPSLLEYEEITSLLEKLPPGANIRLLGKGFPEYNINYTPTALNRVPDYWQLVREMPELHTDSIVVFTNAYYSGLKGKRPTGSNINWVFLDPSNPRSTAIKASRKQDGVEILSAASNATHLRFSKETFSLPSPELSLNAAGDSLRIDGSEALIPLVVEDAINVEIFYEESFDKERKYIQSSFAAISKFIDRPVNINTTTVLEDYNLSAPYLVWISESPAPISAGRQLIFKPDSLATGIINRGEDPNIYFLTDFLNPENILEENLPEELLEFLELNKDLNPEIEPLDKRVVGQNEIQPNQGNEIPEKAGLINTDFALYLWMLLVTLLLAERGLAYYRKQ